MEVILVIVLIVILSSVSLPHMAGSLKGSKLRTTARTVTRMARYARSMAIMRETTLTLALDRETMEIFLGEPRSEVVADDADGKIDQDVLKRLGYKDDDGNPNSSGDAGLDKEARRFLPEGLSVKNFEKEQLDDTEEDPENLHLVRFFSNGQSEAFVLEIEDSRGMGIKLESDPISGKIHSEFTQ